MTEIEKAFEMQRGEGDPEIIDRLISEGRLHQIFTKDGEERLYPSAGYIFERLPECDLDNNLLREVAYRLESRGLLRLHRSVQGWLWQPTLAGRNAGLCTNEIPFHVLLSNLGLTAELERVAAFRRFESGVNDEEGCDDIAG
jgi:hypothetical protein